MESFKNLCSSIIFQLLVEYNLFQIFFILIRFLMVVVLDCHNNRYDLPVLSNKTILFISTDSVSAMVFICFIFEFYDLSVELKFFGYTNSIKIQEVMMKASDKGKRIRTAPKGAWESGNACPLSLRFSNPYRISITL